MPVECCHYPLEILQDAFVVTSVTECACRDMYLIISHTVGNGHVVVRFAHTVCQRERDYNAIARQQV